MTFTITSDAEQTYNYFRRLRVEAPSRVGAVAERGSKLLLASVRSRAPIDTGAYRASMRIEKSSPSRNVYTFEVGSDLPYGMPLEFGGVSIDSTGATHNRKPKPHFRPALKEFEDPFVNAIREVLV